MQESYKRFVNSWIHFANPWICTVSWSQILNPKRFDSCLTKWIQICFISWITNPYCLQKIWFVDLIRRLIFKRFDLFSWIQQILTNPDESLVHRHTLNKPKSIRILSFGFANPYCFQKIRVVLLGSKDLFHGFDSWTCFWKLCFVDSFRENKNPKWLDLFRFGRIHIRLPHPYKFDI
jgi:hypothetical protein